MVNGVFAKTKRENPQQREGEVELDLEGSLTRLGDEESRKLRKRRNKIRMFCF
jgi:hypothetical protein